MITLRTHTFFIIFIPKSNLFVGRARYWNSNKIPLTKNSPRIFTALSHVVQHLKNNKSAYDALNKDGKNAIVVKKTEVLGFDELSFYTPSHQTESATYQDVLAGKFNVSQKRKYKKFPFEFFIRIWNPITGKYYSDKYRRFNKYGKIWQNLPMFIAALRRISEFKIIENQLTKDCKIDIIAFTNGIRSGRVETDSIIITPEIFSDLEKTKVLIEQVLENSLNSPYEKYAKN